MSFITAIAPLVCKKCNEEINLSYADSDTIDCARQYNLHIECADRILKDWKPAITDTIQNPNGN